MARIVISYFFQNVFVFLEQLMEFDDMLRHFECRFVPFIVFVLLFPFVVLLFLLVIQVGRVDAGNEDLELSAEFAVVADQGIKDADMVLVPGAIACPDDIRPLVLERSAVQGRVFYHFLRGELERKEEYLLGRDTVVNDHVVGSHRIRDEQALRLTGGMRIQVLDIRREKRERHVALQKIVHDNGIRAQRHPAPEDPEPPVSPVLTGTVYFLP